MSRRPNPIDARRVQNLVSAIAEEDFHAKRVLSVSHAVLGVIHASALSIHAIGIGMAQARGLNPKHATKQVDRLLSNSGLDVWQFFACWVPYLVGTREEIVVALDWTEFDPDGHATLALYLVTARGRAAPLMWMTVEKSELEGWRNTHEDDLLARFREVVPPTVKVTVLADRGFGDIKLFDYLKRQLGFEYVIRIRGITKVKSPAGEVGPASGWVPGNGRPRQIKHARVTADEFEIGSVVCVHAAAMKEPWILAVSDPELKASDAIKLYGKRFSIEETFRDTKDPHFGLGLSATHIRSTERRDRLLLVAALAHEFLTVLGAAGESLGMDRLLKVNTVKTRTHSLFRQGSYYYGAIPMMRQEKLEALVVRFGQLVLREASFVQALRLE